MPAYLVPVEDGQPVVLDKAIILIGRHPDCDVVLKRSRKVSRRHCCLAQVNSHFVVRDLGSMNGVRINGRRVDTESRVEIGDELMIGDVCFRLQERGNSPRSRRAEPDQRQPGDSPRRPAQGLQPPIPFPPSVLSQEVPVAIPDEDRSFAVESSLRQTPEVEPPFPAAPKKSSDWFDDEPLVLDDPRNAPTPPPPGQDSDFFLEEDDEADFRDGDFRDSDDSLEHGSHVEVLPD